jgi:hypothetical protein
MEADGKRARALALKILVVNAIVLGALAIATWLGLVALFEPRRGLMTAAFAACAAGDAVLALVLVLVSRS